MQSTVTLGNKHLEVFADRKFSETNRPIVVGAKKRNYSGE